MKPVRPNQEAEDEIRAAIAWYESEREGLGRELWEQLQGTVALISEHPAPVLCIERRFAVWHAECRIRSAASGPRARVLDTRKLEKHEGLQPRASARPLDGCSGEKLGGAKRKQVVGPWVEELCVRVRAPCRATSR